jgi:hypothetical protein
MLLKLLQHHEELFMAVLDHFTNGRDARELAAISAANWRLREFILALPWWQHAVKLQKCHNDIKSMNILRNEFVTIRGFYNDIVVYSYYPHNRNSFNLRFNLNKYYVHRGFKQSYSIIHNVGKKYRIMKIDVKYISICVYGNKPEWLAKYSDFIVINGSCTSGYLFKEP